MRCPCIGCAFEKESKLRCSTNCDLRIVYLRHIESNGMATGRVNLGESSISVASSPPSGSAVYECEFVETIPY